MSKFKSNYTLFTNFWQEDSVLRLYCDARVWMGLTDKLANDLASISGLIY